MLMNMRAARINSILLFFYGRKLVRMWFLIDLNFLNTGGVLLQFNSFTCITRIFRLCCFCWFGILVSKTKISYVIMKPGTGWRLAKRLICQSAAHLSNLSTGSATHTHRQFPRVITAAMHMNSNSHLYRFWAPLGVVSYGPGKGKERRGANKRLMWEQEGSVNLMRWRVR